LKCGARLGHDIIEADFGVSAGTTKPGKDPRGRVGWEREVGCSKVYVHTQVSEMLPRANNELPQATIMTMKTKPLQITTNKDDDEHNNNNNDDGNNNKYKYKYRTQNKN